MNLLVVNFHYFSNKIFSSGIYPVSPERFIQQLYEIGKSYTFLSQIELADCFAQQQFPKGNFCLITFDDGLKEQMHAFEHLQTLNIPAVYYIPVKPFVEQTVLDVHKLQLIRTELNDDEILEKLQISKSYCYTTEDALKAATQYKYDNEQARELKFQLNFKLNPYQKQEIVTELFTEIFGSEKAFASDFYMNQNDLNALAEQKQIGAHGYAHVPLSQLQDAQADMKKSIDYLQHTTSQCIRSFSYPFGSKEAVNENVASIAGKLKLDFALTMWRGVNTLTSKTNPFLLNRIDTNDAPGGKSQLTTYQIKP